MANEPNPWSSILRLRRKALGLSQEHVAALTGKTQSQIARLEAGNEDPRLSSVVQVARSLGLEMVAVPVRLLPAVQNLLEQHGEGATAKRQPSRLIGNDPEDLEESGDE